MAAFALPCPAVPSLSVSCSLFVRACVRACGLSSDDGKHRAQVAVEEAKDVLEGGDVRQAKGELEVERERPDGNVDGNLVAEGRADPGGRAPHEVLDVVRHLPVELEREELVPTSGAG